MSRHFSTRRCALAVVCTAASLLCACTTVSLLQLDNEWTRTHQAQLQAESTPSSPEYLATDFETQLAGISDRAAAAGDKVATADAATAIGFYRVAALAAWKSGKQRENRVLVFSEKGRLACKSLPQGPASQPRDCALLEITPHLAAYDRDVRGMQAIKTAADSTATKTIPAEKLVETEDVIKSASAATLRIAAARKTLAGLPLPETFFSYLNATVERMYCTTSGFIGRALAGERERFIDDATQLLEGMKNEGPVPVCP